MVKITGIKRNSIANNLGIKVDDYLISINNHEINDWLDFYFYQSDEVLKLIIERNDKQQKLNIQKSFDEEIGLELEDFKLQSCSNNCVFCFIKQNPPGMRQQIYYCDEDYRYSFLYGNYITLTDLGETELSRIVKQRLSPLYISVHATDADVRKTIFRYKTDDHLMEKLEYLVKNRIELHTQVVLVPDMNDGLILEQTITDLYKFKKMIKSLAIVPVGLTRHRKRLPEIKPVSTELARNLVAQSRKWNKLYRNVEDDPFVYLSDEFYLLAGKPFPGNKHYGPYYQLENGVGLCRQLIDSLKKDSKIVIKNRKNICLVTGRLAEPVIRNYVLPYLNKVDNLEVDMVVIDNEFYGNSVTVSGLLTGKDIIEQFPKDLKYDCIFLPPNCINDDGVMLDDTHPDTVSKELNMPVRIGEYNIKEMMVSLEE